LPAELGTFTTDDDFRSFRTKVARYTTFLGIINASGQPAASLPLQWSLDGLPVGVQLIGHFGGDADVLRLSARLEEALPWKNRRPALAVQS
jgi:amidase